MTVAILTAVTDDYDALKELPALDVECEAICVTDDPDLRSDTWTCVFEPRGETHPNIAAKHAKTRPWDYTDADWTIWVDASFRVTSWSIAEDLLKYGPIGQFVHPDRDCIYTEAAYSAELKKYASQPLDQQASYYRASHPEHWGLWATGLIVRQKLPAVVSFGEAWLSECERWGFQDQVSEAPMLHQFGLRPVEIPGDYFSNPWVRYEGSPRH